MQALVEARYCPDKYSYSSLKTLILDGCRIKKLTVEDSQFLASFQNLTSLCCSGTNLASLQNFPVLPCLTRLELQDNNLSDSSMLDVLAKSVPLLKILRLAGNRLKSLTALINALESLSNLEIVDIDMNPLVSEQGSRLDPNTIRQRLFEKLPHLKIVDGHDADGVEHQDLDDENIDDEEDDEEDENDKAVGEEDEELDDEEVNEEDEEGDEDEEEEIEEDEEEEEELEEDEEEEDPSRSLKAFYEHDFAGDEDENDDDFDPVNQGLEDDEDMEEEDQDFDDDNLEGQEEGEETPHIDGNEDSLEEKQDNLHKRPQNKDSTSAEAAKKQKV